MTTQYAVPLNVTEAQFRRMIAAAAAGPAFQTVAVVASVATIDCFDGAIVWIDLTSDVELALSNTPEDSRASIITVHLVQDATGGRVVTVPSGWFTEDGAQPMVNPDALALTRLQLLVFSPGGTLRVSVLQGVVGETAVA